MQAVHAGFQNVAGDALSIGSASSSGGVQWSMPVTSCARFGVDTDYLAAFSIATRRAETQNAVSTSVEQQTEQRGCESGDVRDV